MTKISHRSRPVFLVEICLAALTGVLTVVTLISREWIEFVFGVPRPRQRIARVAACRSPGAASLIFGLLARREWRKPLSAAHALSGPRP